MLIISSNNELKIVQHPYICQPIPSVTFQEGAQTSIYLSVSEDVTTTGGYFADCKKSACSPVADDVQLAEKLWTKSAELVQLESHEMFV